MLKLIELNNVYIPAYVFKYGSNNKPSGFISADDNVGGMDSLGKNFIYNDKDFECNRCFSSPINLWNHHNIMCIDIDCDLVKMSEDNKVLFDVLRELKKYSICQILSSANHATLMLKIEDEYRELLCNKKYQDMVFKYGEIVDKNGICRKKAEEHIEVLHITNKRLCFGLNDITVNGQSDGYYTLKYLNGEVNGKEVINILDKVYNMCLNKIEEKVKASNNKSSKTQKVDVDEVEKSVSFYQNMLLKPEKLYTTMVKNKGDKVEIYENHRNDPLNNFWIWLYIHNPYASYDDWCLFKDYIVNNIDDGAFNSGVNLTYENELSNKEVLKVPENTKQLMGYMSIDSTGKPSRLVLKNDYVNGGYEIIRPKCSSDSKAMFGDIDYSNMIREIYNTNNDRINDIIYVEDGFTYFNHAANKVAGLKIRNEWLKDNSIYNDVELNDNTRKCINNIFGKNSELFMKKEAIVVATLKKLKFIDMIASKERNIGKSSIVKTFSKCKIPEHKWNMVNSYIAGRPESDGKRIKFAGSVTNESVSIHIDEDSLTRVDFEFIKGLQSPVGFDVAKKGKDSSNINPPSISAYYTFNLGSDHSNIYYSKRDVSYNTTVCFTVNENAKDINDPLLDIDLDYLNSKECIHNLTKYLLKLYTSMSKEEIVNISKNYPAMSSYNMDDYLEESDKSKTENIVDQYIEAIESYNINNVNDFLGGDELFNYMSRSRVNKEVIDVIKEYIDNTDFSKSYTYKIHKCVCCLLNIETRKYKFCNYFTGRSDKHTYISKENF